MEIKNIGNKERYKKRNKNNSIRGRPVVGTGRKERGKKKTTLGSCFHGNWPPHWILPF